MYTTQNNAILWDNLIIPMGVITVKLSFQLKYLICI